MSMRLNDKSILVFIAFSSVLLLLSFFLLDLSLELFLLFSNAVYMAAFAFHWYFDRLFLRRVRELAIHVQEMAAGNIRKNLGSGGKDEIGQLTNALNELFSRLRSGVAMEVGRHQEIAQAKTDFVALASHQLRTPLSIIKWYADFVLSGDAGALNSDQSRYLKEVYVANERLIDLVNALLDVSRIDVGTFSIEPEETDLISRLESALSRFLPGMEAKNITLEKVFSDIPLINLDPRLTKIVFENLLSNALKYTAPGGKIRITVKRSDPNVLIKISDNGCGIPREEQPKIFTKMFRAANAKHLEAGGTGLGLYIAKAVVEKSGGRIWFESPSLELLSLADQNEHMVDSKRYGTTFFITIPLLGMKPKAGTKKLESLETKSN